MQLKTCLNKANQHVSQKFCATVLNHLRVYRFEQFDFTPIRQRRVKFPFRDTDLQQSPSLSPIKNCTTAQQAAQVFDILTSFYFYDSLPLSLLETVPTRRFIG